MIETAIYIYINYIVLKRINPNHKYDSSKRILKLPIVRVLWTLGARVSDSGQHRDSPMTSARRLFRPPAIQSSSHRGDPAAASLMHTLTYIHM